MKSGNLNSLEPSGPVQACNVTAVPFYKHTLRLYNIHCVSTATMFASKQHLNIAFIRALSCFEYVAGTAKKEKGFEITDAKVKTY